MRLSIKKEIFPIIFLVLSWALGIYFYTVFPDRVISHWNFEGVADGYSGKTIGAFGLPAILTVMYVFFLAIPFIDPKKDRYESFERVYQIFKLVFITFLFAIYVVMGLVNMGYDIPMNLAVPALVGSMFIIMGNFLGKLKQNWFIGIRLPWTMSSENVWNKTNRFGGWSMVLCGILIILSPLFPKSLGLPIFFLGILMVTIGTGIYSYIIYRKEQQPNI